MNVLRKYIDLGYFIKYLIFIYSYIYFIVYSNGPVCAVYSLQLIITLTMRNVFYYDNH